MHDTCNTTFEQCCTCNTVLHVLTKTMDIFAARSLYVPKFLSNLTVHKQKVTPPIKFDFSLEVTPHQLSENRSYPHQIRQIDELSHKLHHYRRLRIFAILQEIEAIFASTSGSLSSDRSDTDCTSRSRSNSPPSSPDTPSNESLIISTLYRRRLETNSQPETTQSSSPN